MTGNTSIDLSLANVWRSWYRFNKGKRRTLELEIFEYNLERNLIELQVDLKSGRYIPGQLRHFMIYDNKKRQISVAPIRDRVVHRLIYDYLVEVYDKKFDFDVWSCREDKGSDKAIARAYYFLRKYSGCFIWRADIRKFFESVDKRVLMKLLIRKLSDRITLDLLWKTISAAAPLAQHGDTGIPIGNLTSQIFANIYLNEFDRFVRHRVKPLAYMRYGDDFLVLANNKELLKTTREEAIEFLYSRLSLELNRKNEAIIPCNRGIKFLGVNTYLSGIILNQRNQSRITKKLDFHNIASYRCIISKYYQKGLPFFGWKVANLLSIA